MTTVDPVEAMLLEEIRTVRERPLVPLVSKLAREAGEWRAQADALAKLLRTEVRPWHSFEVVAALAAYDQLTARCDDE